MQTLKLIITLLITILIVTLILANPWMLQEKFSISYLGYKSPEIHMVVLLLVAITVGAIITALSMFCGQLRLKKIIRDHKKKIRQIEEELSSLRNLPLRENPQLTSSCENDNTLIES